MNTPINLYQACCNLPEANGPMMRNILLDVFLAEKKLLEAQANLAEAKKKLEQELLTDWSAVELVKAGVSRFLR